METGSTREAASAADLSDPVDLFAAWFAEAQDKETVLPEAVALATADAAGRPSVRMVLLKGFDARGFVFYTNTESRKGRELAENTHAALLFHWKSLRRQVRIEGVAVPVAPEEADAYFATRDRGARIGAWASDQSRPMTGRFDLEKRVAVQTARFAVGEVPRPPYWSGYRIVPDRFEFWSDGRFRLHERLVFERGSDGWQTSRLFP
ncbi:MAG: pyridoxamine 5'-phosphate oxidase [Alphaproteobacteria bacterium]